MRGSLCQQPKRRRLGHQYASPRPTARVKHPERKTFEIACVNFIDPTEFCDEDGIIPSIIPNYSLGKDDILFSGTVDLMTDDNETAIKSKIVEVLQTRIPGIKTTDFTFVKVVRKLISSPACREDHKWDFPQVKAMAGQGKLYVRLTKSSARHRNHFRQHCKRENPKSHASFFSSQ